MFSHFSSGENENFFTIFHLLCLMSTLSLLLLLFFSFNFSFFILSSFPFFLCRHNLLYFPFTLHLCAFHIYRSLNELLPYSHTSLLPVSLPFHFPGSFSFVFFVISLFHSSSYSFSFISAFIIIHFTTFSPICFFSASPLSLLFFILHVIIVLLLS